MAITDSRQEAKPGVTRNVPKSRNPGTPSVHRKQWITHRNLGKELLLPFDIFGRDNKEYKSTFLVLFVEMIKLTAFRSGKVRTR